MKKEDRIISILNRWVKGEIKTDQADRELELHGVPEPKPVVKLHPGNMG